MPAADDSGLPIPNARVDPAKDASRIAGMFERISVRYDFLNHLLSSGLD
jgi:ubiquinone/menaquinone biosynthesis C-methylase UbiE